MNHKVSNVRLFVFEGVVTKNNIILSLLGVLYLFEYLETTGYVTFISNYIFSKKLFA